MSFDNQISEKIESDEFYKSFLTNERSSDFGSQLTLSEQINKLSEGLQILSAQLQQQVREQHGALLSQASHAGRLVAALNSVSGHMTRLQSGARCLRTQVCSNYELVETQTKVLGRLHEASHILRLSGRLLQLSRKLRDTKDPVKQAIILYELEPLTEDSSLNKVDFIVNERAYVISTRQRLNSSAQMDLVNGLKDGKEAVVTESLQTFANLHTISKCIDNLIETFLNEIGHSIKECFAGTDVSTLSSSKPFQSGTKKENNRGNIRGPGKTPSLMTSQNFSAKLLKAFHWLIHDELADYCIQISLLQKSLNLICHTVDMSSEEILSINVQQKFWKRIEDLFTTSFKECPPHIQQSLQEGLPQLLSAAKGLESKVTPHIIFNSNAFESLEAGYLEKCASNIKFSLAGTDCPTTDTVDNLMRSASMELSAAMVDNRLLTLVANVFNACNKDFWTKIEAHIKLGPDAKQVVDVPNTTQIQNANLANIIFYHAEAVKRLISNLGGHFANSSAVESIINKLKDGKLLTLTILQQLIDSIESTTGIILLSMHREPGLNTEKIATVGPSLYMKELQDFLQRCWSQHILPFTDKETTNECALQIASRCIEVFVNNLAILKPLSTSGRNRLKNDCSHLEKALNPIVTDLGSLGKSFRLLRAMSSLIIKTPEILIDEEVQFEAAVPCYLVLLLFFSHGGTDLQSPHIAAGWSNEKLMQWLDGHTSEKERLDLIASALQKYRTVIRQKNITQYDPVYPLLSNYFEKAYKALFKMEFK